MMEPKEELKALITAFRANPLVKGVAKTKANDLRKLSDQMTEDEKVQLFRIYRGFISHPLMKKIAQSEGEGYKPKSFNPNSYDTISMLYRIKDMLSAGSRVVRGALPADLKKELVNWVENNSRSARLDSYSTDRLFAIPDIRPSTPTLLFRGMLFRKWQFEPRHNEHPSSADPIASALMRGQEHFTFQSHRCSSWTHSKKIAYNLATSRAATSEYAATLQWLHKKGKIDGKLGVIIATRALPDDIVVDLSKVDLGYTQHGDESEMILMPGKRIVRILTILTPDGEISVEEFPEYHKELSKEFDNGGMR